jgi:ATPase subunit of ABC transporter with duplicated ATPase domains
MAGQRIGILGANGQGKSTLVKTIARVLQRAPAAGVSEGKGLNIGYFAQQELDVLRPERDPSRTPDCDWRAKACRPDRATASRICAPSSAPSISAATWSSRRSAR